MVFGNGLEKASHHFIPQLSESEQILIVGGGTGEILEQFTSNQTVHFVDSSATMIALAKKRKHTCSVQFHHCRFEDFIIDQTYNDIWFPFFLDQFNDEEIATILDNAQRHLRPTGKMVIVDFIPVNLLSKWHQKLLLRTVIVFFTITTKHPIRKIFNIVESAKQTNFQLVKQKYFVNGMVIASLWQKAEH